MTPRDPRPTARPLLAAAALAAAILLGACSSGRGPASAAGAGTAGSVPAADSVRPGLEPGDAVLLRIHGEPTLSDTLRVDEDGRVVFPLLGARDVTGVPADSLKRRLVEDYRRYVTSPAIEVTVLRRISVLGEVRRPGLYPVDATHSLADALALAGGTTPSADEDDIRLVRRGTVVRESLERARSVASTPVRSGDQIVVGRKSWLSRNWQWLAGTVVSGGLIVLTR